MERILVINPGATSTKFAIFDNEEVVMKEIVEHQGTDLENFKTVYEQHQYRLDLILSALKQASIPVATLTAVVARGGLLKPLAGGTYRVTAGMVEDLKSAKYGEHASNLGAVLAYHLAEELHIAAFIVDPVSVDELTAVARLSGSPDFERVSMSHALNMKAVARKVAKDLGKKYEEVNLIITHLGTGVSVSAHRGGKMIDTIDGKDEGPFAPDRSGGLPASQLVKMCYSGKYTLAEMQKRVFGAGGLYAYLGTKDIRVAEKMALEGNEKAELVLQALVYQVAKEIGSLATVLKGKVDGIVLTGGIAYSKRIVAGITESVKFIGPMMIIPGEEELESLAAGAIRVLQGEEEAQFYQ